jgi:hypothetical protein
MFTAVGQLPLLLQLLLCSSGLATSTAAAAAAAAGSSCIAVLEASCSTHAAKAHSLFDSENCSLCAGKEQHALRVAGCTAAEVQAYCRSLPASGGGRQVRMYWSRRNPATNLALLPADAPATDYITGVILCCNDPVIDYRAGSATHFHGTDISALVSEYKSHNLTVDVCVGLHPADFSPR